MEAVDPAAVAAATGENYTDDTLQGQVGGKSSCLEEFGLHFFPLSTAGCGKNLV